MRDWNALKERYLRDELPIRLGNLASNLARIKSRYSWAGIWEDAEQRMRVGEEGRIWSEKVLNMSGLLVVN